MSVKRLPRDDIIALLRPIMDCRDAGIRGPFSFEFPRRADILMMDRDELLEILPKDISEQSKKAGQHHEFEMKRSGAITYASGTIETLQKWPDGLLSISLGLIQPNFDDFRSGINSRRIELDPSLRALAEQSPAEFPPTLDSALSQQYAFPQNHLPQDWADYLISKTQEFGRALEDLSVSEASETKELVSRIESRKFVLGVILGYLVSSYRLSRTYEGAVSGATLQQFSEFRGLVEAGRHTMRKEWKEMRSSS